MQRLARGLPGSTRARSRRACDCSLPFLPHGRRWCRSSCVRWGARWWPPTRHVTSCRPRWATHRATPPAWRWGGAAAACSSIPAGLVHRSRLRECLPWLCASWHGALRCTVCQTLVECPHQTWSILGRALPGVMLLTSSYGSMPASNEGLCVSVCGRWRYRRPTPASRACVSSCQPR